MLAELLFDSHATDGDQDFISCFNVDQDQYVVTCDSMIVINCCLLPVWKPFVTYTGDLDFQSSKGQHVNYCILSAKPFYTLACTL